MFSTATRTWRSSCRSPCRSVGRTCGCRWSPTGTACSPEETRTTCRSRRAPAARPALSAARRDGRRCTRDASRVSGQRQAVGASVGSPGEVVKSALLFRGKQRRGVLDVTQWHPANSGGAPNPSAHLNRPQREQTRRTHAGPGLGAGIRKRLRAQVSKKIQSKHQHVAPSSEFTVGWSPALRCRCRGSASRRWRRWAGRTGRTWTTSSRAAIRASGRPCKCAPQTPCLKVSRLSSDRVFDAPSPGAGWWKTTRSPSLRTWWCHRGASWRTWTRSSRTRWSSTWLVKCFSFLLLAWLTFLTDGKIWVSAAIKEQTWKSGAKTGLLRLGGHDWGRVGMCHVTSSA